MSKKASPKKAQPKQADLVIDIVVETIKSSEAIGDKITIGDTFEFVKELRAALKKAGFS
jgi:hypothetical protein